MSSVFCLTLVLFFSQNGNSPLHEAAYFGYLDTVKVLLQHGADLSLCNKVSVIVNWYRSACSVVGSCMQTIQS